MRDGDGGERDGIVIRRLAGDGEARAAAVMMAGTEPWITLGRDVEQTYGMVTRRGYEGWVAMDGEAVVGVVLFSTAVSLVNGYVGGLAVSPPYRNRGVGRRLLAVAEERILRESPNVFLCVSSFNAGARRLYERLGYVKVGELADFVVAGCSEVLMRKTVGPWQGFVGHSESRR